MGWLDKLRRGGGARADERPTKVAVLGLDGVGLPLVRDLIARGITPNLARLAAAGTMAPMRSSIPTISSVSWTGFMTGKNPGKHGIYEFLPVSDAIKGLILERASSGLIKDAAVKQGMRPLRDDGWRNVRNGNTTVSEVVRVSQEEV